MTLAPQSIGSGHLGLRDAATFATMDPVRFAGNSVFVDDGSNVLQEYWSNGTEWSQTPTAGQVRALSTLAQGDFSNAVYDGSGRLVSYSRVGVPHTVAYPDAFHAVITNTSGAPARTVTLDGSGRATALI
jgi:hypothetical protein